MTSQGGGCRCSGNSRQQTSKQPLPTGCPAVFFAGGRPGSAAREEAAGAAFADLVASLLVAGHEVRPGWKRGGSMGAGGCRSSGRSRQAAGRCRCHRLDVAAVDTGGLIRRAWVAAAALFCGRRWARSEHHQVTIEESNTWCPRAPEEAVHTGREYHSTGKEWRRRRTILMP